MWIARNKDGKLLLFKYKPYRTIKDTWASYECSGVEMENEVFPSIKWEDEPVEVSIIPTKELLYTQNQLKPKTFFDENFGEVYYED